MDPFDHRHLGNELDLFHFEPEAPGMVFWHPRGLALLQTLEGALRRILWQDGFREVRTPQLLRLPIWQASGHLSHFAGGMFHVPEEGAPAALKPVNCPGHMKIAHRMSLSYRDLPLRLAEFGVVHRNEPSGTLHGLFRLRQFTQDDGHIFCLFDQVEAEVERFCRSLRELYAALGFEAMQLAFSDRPPERVGDDASWDRAEQLLQSAAQRAGLPLSHHPGEGAFYGPKLEFVLQDRSGRSWQCGTIQLDLFLPERFDVQYADRDGRRQRPVMLHRALLGSLERFLGILLEHHQGRLPAWLAPEQVVVLPVAEECHAYAREVERVLRGASLRARADLRAESLSKKIAEAHDLAIPVAAVVGPREAAARSVAIRAAPGRAVLPLDEAVPVLRQQLAP